MKDEPFAAQSFASSDALRPLGKKSDLGLTLRPAYSPRGRLGGGLGELKEPHEPLQTQIAAAADSADLFFVSGMQSEPQKVVQP